MSRFETHLAKARKFQEGADRATSPEVQVVAWFLAAYHLIEACAAKHRIHIQKHQRVPEELRLNPGIFVERTKEVSRAYQYLDGETRAKFVYGASGTDEELELARSSFETVRRLCEEALR